MDFPIKLQNSENYEALAIKVMKIMNPEFLQFWARKDHLSFEDHQVIRIFNYKQKFSLFRTLLNIRTLQSNELNILIFRKMILGYQVLFYNQFVKKTGQKLENSLTSKVLFIFGPQSTIPINSNLAVGNIDNLTYQKKANSRIIYQFHYLKLKNGIAPHFSHIWDFKPCYILLSLKTSCNRRS